jgi:hypothetical protein
MLLKVDQKMMQKVIFMIDKMGGLKLIKIYRKMGVKIIVKNRPKICPKNQFSRGGSTGLKLSKIDLGGPGPQFKNFLKFCTFLQKLPTFRPPFSTPKKGPIGKPIPHK